jgi:hypothetical protein
MGEICPSYVVGTTYSASGVRVVPRLFPAERRPMRAMPHLCGSQGRPWHAVREGTATLRPVRVPQRSSRLASQVVASGPPSFGSLAGIPSVRSDGEIDASLGYEEPVQGCGAKEAVRAIRARAATVMVILRMRSSK